MNPPVVELYPRLPAEKLRVAADNINKNKAKFEAPFFMEPYKHVDLTEIKKVCDPILAKGVKNIIVLGTGGSIQTLLALQYLAPRRILPLPSSRPSELKDALKTTSSQDSVVLPISRGGETLDINSTISLFKNYPMIALSARGAMFNLVKLLNATIMDVPDLSGRFAGACTNVGLVPAYLAGINVKNFLDGTVGGYKIYNPQVPIEQNPAKTFAAYLYYLHKQGFTNVFSMPYSRWLEGSVGLFVQEISESTGKGGKGVLGTSQPAPICQHSVLELLLGGSQGHSIPVLWETRSDPDNLDLLSTLPELQNQTALDVIRYQADATFEALLSRGIPAAKLTIESPAEENIGQLIAFIQSTVYYLCLMLEVNWADNPMVVIGKKICNEAMARNLTDVQRQANRSNVAREKFDSKFYP
ncbi:MAG: phosphoglucose isomerase [Promethearchaeota archaeon CR_4]|nr:MAG: phosphoglucose isomerase [Candidatus Lokiarchaeota archaeon CR_4]